MLSHIDRPGELKLILVRIIHFRYLTPRFLCTQQTYIRFGNYDAANFNISVCAQKIKLEFSTDYF